MARLIMWNLMTLDGFFEGPDHDLSFHLDVWGKELEDFSIEQGQAADGFVFGRVTYELMAGHFPKQKGTIADFMNGLPKFVFSRTLTQSDWNNTQLFNTDVPGTVARLKREAKKDIFLFGSADLATELIQHKLIDEFRIGIAPILLGKGTPLFKSRDAKINLKLVDSRALSNGMIIARYVQ